MGLFSRKDNTPKSSPAAAEQTAADQAEARANTLNKLNQARTHANKIIANLNSINYNKIRGQENIRTAKVVKYIDGEKVIRTGEEIVNDMESYIKTISAKIAKEDITDLVIDETERIDSRLVLFSGLLVDALNRGDLRTAEVCEIALIYGIVRGHAPIPQELDMMERDRELTERENKIDIYKKMVSAAKEMQRIAETKSNLSKQYMNEVVPKYEEAHEDFLKDKAANQSIYDAIAGKSGDELTGEYLVAWKKTARDNNLYRTAENIVTEIAAIENNLSNYELSMINLKNALDLQSVSFNSELQMQIDLTLSQIPDKMLEINQTTLKTQASLDKMFKEFNSVMNDPDLRLSMAKASEISRKIEAKEKKREQQRKDDEEAQIAKWELEAEEAEAEAIRRQKLQEAKMKALEKQLEVDKTKTETIEKPIVKKKKQIKGMD